MLFQIYLLITSVWASVGFTQTETYAEYKILSHPECYLPGTPHVLPPNLPPDIFKHVCEGSPPSHCVLKANNDMNSTTCSAPLSGANPIRLLYSTWITADFVSRPIFEVIATDLRSIGDSVGTYFEIYVVQGDCSERTILERVGTHLQDYIFRQNIHFTGALGPACFQSGAAWMNSALLPYDLALIAPYSITAKGGVLFSSVSPNELANNGGQDIAPYLCRIKQNEIKSLRATASFLYQLNWTRIGILEDALDVETAPLLQEWLETLGGDGYGSRRVVAQSILNFTEHLRLAPIVENLDTKIIVHMGIVDSMAFQICAHLNITDNNYELSVFGRHRLNYVGNDVSAPTFWLPTALFTASDPNFYCRELSMYELPLKSYLQIAALSASIEDHIPHGISKRNVSDIIGHYTALCSQVNFCNNDFFNAYDAVFMFYAAATVNGEIFSTSSTPIIDIESLNKSVIYNRLQELDFFGVTGPVKFDTTDNDCERIGEMAIMQTSNTVGMYPVATLVQPPSGRLLEDGLLSSLPVLTFTKNLSFGHGIYDNVNMADILEKRDVDAYPKAFEECQIGEFFDYTTGACKNCSVGTFGTLNNDNRCQPCPAGRASNISGWVDPIDTKPGTECLSCQVGYIQPDQGGSQCTKCPPGFSWKSSVQCAECRPGSFTDETTSTGLNCVSCPKGTYQSKFAATSCNSCMATIPNRGKLSTMQVTSKSIGDCGCAPGYFIPCLDPSNNVIENRDSSELLDSCNLNGASYESTTNQWKQRLVRHCPKSLIANVSSFDMMKPSLTCRTCPDGFECPGGFKQIVYNAQVYEVHSPPILLKHHMSLLSDPYFAMSCLAGSRKSQCVGETDIPCTCVLPDEQTGPACSICRGSASMTTTGECKQCTSAGTAVVALLGILGVFAVVIGAYYLCNSPITAEATTLLVVAVMFGMLTTFMQSLAIFSMLSIEWPSSITGFLESFLFTVASFDFLNLGCAVPDRRSVALRMMMIAIVPFLLGVAIFICWVASNRLKRPIRKEIIVSSESRTSNEENTKDPERPTIKRTQSARYEFEHIVTPWNFARSLNTFGYIFQALFILLISLGAIAFTCYSHPDGETKSLQAYPYVICGSDEHTPVLILGVLITLLYVIGFYTTCLWAIWVAPIKSFQSTYFISTFRFLFYRFRPDRYYWGAVVLLRSTLITFSSVIIPENPNSQFIFLVTILLIFLIAQVRFWPWKTRLLNLCDVFVFSVLLLFICVGNVFVPATDGIGYVILAICLISSCFVAIGVLTATAILNFIRKWRNRRREKRQLRENSALNILGGAPNSKAGEDPEEYIDPKLELLAQNWRDMIHYLSMIDGGSVAHTSYLRIFGEYDRKKINETTYLILDTLPEMFFAIADKCGEKGPAYLQFLRAPNMPSTKRSSVSNVQSFESRKGTTEQMVASPPRRVTTTDVVGLNEEIMSGKSLLSVKKSQGEEEAMVTRGRKNSLVPKMTLNLDVPEGEGIRRKTTVDVTNVIEDGDEMYLNGMMHYAHRRGSFVKQKSQNNVGD